MAQKSLNQIRDIFLKFFVKNDHKIIESSNLVPNNDPTLMFTNSGMVQFKNIFTGLEKNPSVAAEIEMAIREKAGVISKKIDGNPLDPEKIEKEKKVAENEEAKEDTAPSKKN